MSMYLTNTKIKQRIKSNNFVLSQSWKIDNFALTQSWKVDKYIASNSENSQRNYYTKEKRFYTRGTLMSLRIPRFA